MSLLTTVFATHPPARVEILNSCQAKLIGATEAQSLPYLCVLGKLVRDYPGLISSHLPSLKVRTEPLNPDMHCSGCLICGQNTQMHVMVQWQTCASKTDLSYQSWYSPGLFIAQRTYRSGQSCRHPWTSCPCWISM